MGMYNHRGYDYEVRSDYDPDLGKIVYRFIIFILPDDDDEDLVSNWMDCPISLVHAAAKEEIDLLVPPLIREIQDATQA